MKYINRLKPTELDDLLMSVGFAVVKDRDTPPASINIAAVTTEKKYVKEEDCYIVSLEWNHPLDYFHHRSNFIKFNDFEILKFSVGVEFYPFGQPTEESYHKFRRFLYRIFGKEYMRDCEEYLNQKLEKVKTKVKDQIAVLEKELEDTYEKVQKDYTNAFLLNKKKNIEDEIELKKNKDEAREMKYI